MTSTLKEQITAVSRARMTRRHQAQFDDGLSFAATKDADALSDVIASLEHSAELQRTFDLQWAADQRAIKMWQEAHPGCDLVWPDRCDMVVWLLDQLAPKPGAKVLDHKWLDPECVEAGCQSLRMRRVTETLREPPQELRRTVDAAIRDKSTWGGYAQDAGALAMRAVADWLVSNP